MMNYVEMQLRPDGGICKVYDITDGQATIWSDSLFAQCDCGWMKVKVSRLVPEGYGLHNNDFVSKTQEAKAKKRMHLEDATWKTSDGLLWRHTDIKEAIQHELKLMNENEALVSVPHS